MLSPSEKRRIARRLEARREKRRIEQGLPAPETTDDESDGPQADRRVQAMTREEVEDWLRRHGITGGDRRTADRRKKGGGHGD